MPSACDQNAAFWVHNWEPMHFHVWNLLQVEGLALDNNKELYQVSAIFLQVWVKKRLHFIMWKCSGSIILSFANVYATKVLTDQSMVEHTPKE